MSIEHYTTPEALALLDEIGWPTFLDEASGLTCCLCMYHGQICARIDGDMVTDPPAHVTLCLLRDHLRGYIAPTGIYVDTRINQAGAVEHFVYDSDGDFVGSFMDIDEALLTAATEALMKERKDWRTSRRNFAAKTSHVGVR